MTQGVGKGTGRTESQLPVVSKVNSKTKGNTAKAVLFRSLVRINCLRTGFKKAADWEAGSISVRKYPEMQMCVQPEVRVRMGSKGRDQ